jgi:hypothetical protein
MGDLKSFWPDPVMSPGDTGLSGDGVTQSGSDPQVTVDSPNGLTQVLWSNPPVPNIGGEETENSVSGLPLAPVRFEPSAEPPEPPSLKDRSPGTIDQQ